MDVGSNLSWQGIKRKAVYTGRECTGWGVYTGGAKFFKFVFKIDQSEATKSHMFSTSLRLTNHKLLMAK